MAYPPLAPSRRSRRRRWLFVALLVFITIAIIALATRYRTEQRAVSDYLAAVEEIAMMQSEAAASFEALIADIDGVERPELMNALAMIADDTAAAEEVLEAVAAPPPAVEAHGYLSIAVASWTEAVSVFDQAVALVLDKPEDEAGSDLLRQAITSFELGDAAYTGFLEAVAAMDPELVTRSFRAIAFAPDTGVVALSADDVTLQLRAAFTLEAVRDISVTGVTDPEAVAFQEGTDIPVIPFSESFAVNAVVANEGNETEALVSVNLSLTPSDGGDDAVSMVQTVAELAPGAATTLVFDGIDLRPGGLYELVVVAAVDEDGDATNNTWRTLIFRNADA